MSYKILTDSCCDFPPQRYRELGLISLPLSITFRGETYPDRNDDSLRDMYAVFGPERLPPPPPPIPSNGRRLWSRCLPPGKMR